MSADTGERLRTLARDHFEGHLSLESYRKLRAQLLDGLLAPAPMPSSDTTRPRAASELEVTTRPRTVTPRSGAQHPEPAPRLWARAGMRRIVLLVALGLVLAVAVALLVWFETRARAAQRTSAAVGAAASATHGADSVRMLLQPLLNERRWSDARLRALNDALVKIGPARIVAERNTEWFNAVVNSVRNRLRQRQALAAAPLTPETSPLDALAQTLGVGLGSPAARERLRKQH